MKQSRDPNAVYCLDLVRSTDLDRYLSTLLAGEDQQRALFALYAFDAEISSIAGQVSEPAIGEIRLQWWRDTLDGLYGAGCDHHPVASELQLIVHQHDLPKHLLGKLIDAHQFDLYRTPMATLDDLIAYQTATDVAITDLAARILIGYDALEITFSIEQAGMARGMAKLISTLPGQVARQQCFLPADMLAKHDLGLSQIMARENAVGLQLMIARFRHIIDDHLKQLRLEQNRLKKPVLPAFYPASLADLTLKIIASPKHNPLKQFAASSQLKMQWLLLKKSLFEQV